MTPRQLAEQVYQSEECSRSFLQDCLLHRRYGVVIDTPSVFMLGRAVSKDAPVELLLNPRHTFPVEQCDAWFVWLLGGSLREAMQHMPFYLPWLGWERGNVMRSHLTQRVLRT